MNRVQLYGQLLADPDIQIKKSGAMAAHLSLETHFSWQEELGEWRYSADLHHITVYREKCVIFLQEKVKKGDQIAVQGILTYGENAESPHHKKRNLQIIVPRQNGLIFQLKDNQNVTKLNKSFPFREAEFLEITNENKPSKNVHEIE